ncbi:MAG: hypothetical protein RL264_2745 [Bacteroidota bacterium]|jgi:XTP/dITP diphosphohydrolase
MKTLIFASQNENKAREIEFALDQQLKVVTLAAMDYHDDIPETAETLEGNALLKARTIFEEFGQACFADDTGLEVVALNGAPGVYSARYAGEEKSAKANMEKLLLELENEPNRKAQFRTVIALIDENGEHLFEGKVEGSIAFEPSGNEGFGYDPIFIPENETRTFAEMSLEEKNRLSHRKRAVEKMRNQLLNSSK